MYQEFANSFEVILGPGFDTIYSKYSNDRVDEFKIRTDIAIDRAGRIADGGAPARDGPASRRTKATHPPAFHHPRSALRPA